MKAEGAGRVAAVALGAALLVALGFGGRASAEVLGVIILPHAARDAALADNLSEVAMARIAEVPGRRLVGTAELRRRAGGDAGKQVQACLAEPRCLGGVGVALGASRIVTGGIRTDGARFLLNLNLTDVAAGRVEAQLFKAVDGDVSALVRVVQDAVDELFTPKAQPGRLRVRSQPEGARVAVDDVYIGTSPLVSSALSPGRHRVRIEPERYFAWKTTVEIAPGQEIHLNVGPQQLESRKTWAPYAVYGSAGAAALCFSTGALFAAQSRVTPMGATREEAQADLQRRQTYGHTAVGLFIGGAVLATGAGVVLRRYWRDIFGD